MTEIEIQDLQQLASKTNTNLVLVKTIAVALWDIAYQVSLMRQGDARDR